MVKSTEQKNVKHDNSINFSNNSDSQKTLLYGSNKANIRHYHLHCNASEKKVNLN
jgi:hypothetical protein